MSSIHTGMNVSSETSLDDSGSGQAEAQAVQLCNVLRPIWASRNQADLEARHAVGRQINDELGLPSQGNQSYGEQVIPLVCRELGLKQSAVSQMRNFAERFDSVETLRRDYPDVQNWTDVRKLLPQLRKASRRSTKEVSPLDEIGKTFSRRGRRMGHELGQALSGLKPSEKSQVIERAIRSLMTGLTATGGEFDRKASERALRGDASVVEIAKHPAVEDRQAA